MQTTIAFGGLACRRLCGQDESRVRYFASRSLAVFATICGLTQKIAPKRPLPPVTASAAKFEGAEGREIKRKIRGVERTFTGVDYLFQFALPNFYFHLTAAYAILRHNGIEIGKTDFLGSFG